MVLIVLFGLLGVQSGGSVFLGLPSWRFLASSPWEIRRSSAREMYISGQIHNYLFPQSQKPASASER